MTKQEYIKEIMRALDVSKSEKKRIESDLDSDIQTALEHGESIDEVIRRMGEPEEVASEFMMNSGKTVHDLKYIKVLKIVLAGCAIFIAGFFMNALLMKLTEVTAGGPDYRQSFYLSIFWLILMILLIAVEIATLGLTTIWFAGGALLALIAALFGFNTIVQVVLFCIVSGVLLFVTRPIAVKYFNKTRERTNADRLIGRTAVVTQDIDNTHGTGEVVVAGMIWTARASVENHRISKGDTVEILSISGAKLIVRKK